MRISIDFQKIFFLFAIAMIPLWGILAALVSALGIWVGVIEGFGWKDPLN